MRKLANETNEMNIERRRVFYQIYEETGSIEEATKYSNIRINMKHMKCTYPKPIMDKMEHYLSGYANKMWRQSLRHLKKWNDLYSALRQ